MFDFFKPVIDAGSKAFSWMEANPNTTKFLSGVIGGAAQGYLSAQQAKELKEMEMLKMEQQERFNARKASSGKGYDSHSSNLVGGTGLLAPEMGRM